MVIGLTGRIRSGKSSVALHLKRKYGAVRYRNSEILEAVLTILGKEHSRKNLADLGSALFGRFGNALLAEVILDRIQPILEPERPAIVVIDGIRFREEVALYRNLPTFQLLGVLAESQVRYERSLRSDTRARSDELNLTYDQFLAQEATTNEGDVDSLVAKADWIVTNVASMDSLCEEVDRWLGTIGFSLG
jgi:dephospho-CoA kinase